MPVASMRKCCRVTSVTAGNLPQGFLSGVGVHGIRPCPISSRLCRQPAATSRLCLESAVLVKRTGSAFVSLRDESVSSQFDGLKWEIEISRPPHMSYWTNQWRVTGLGPLVGHQPRSAICKGSWDDRNTANDYLLYGSILFPSYPSSSLLLLALVAGARTTSIQHPLQTRSISPFTATIMQPPTAARIEPSTALPLRRTILTMNE